MSTAHHYPESCTTLLLDGGGWSSLGSALFIPAAASWSIIFSATVLLYKVMNYMQTVARCARHSGRAQP